MTRTYALLVFACAAACGDKAPPPFPNMPTPGPTAAPAPAPAPTAAPQAAPAPAPSQSPGKPLLTFTPTPGGPAPGSPEFSTYTETIPGTKITFTMVPIPGGTFTMGSAADEAGRRDDEGPQLRVTVAPFWLGRCEVTWSEYDTFNNDEQLKMDKKPDGMSRPTPPYTDMTFGMNGSDDRGPYPAICMSHVAAREYCRWLSAHTHRFYRLPTEAEWEHAARGGTTTPWWCDQKELAASEWFAGSDTGERNGYHKVGGKKPNPFGLCDMLGNVSEWVADRYDAATYHADHGGAERSDPYVQPRRDEKGRPERFGHVARGGSWRDDAVALRAAARHESVPEWNQRDPQIPKSWWYLTEGQFLGFRIARPFREPAAADKEKFEKP